MTGSSYLPLAGQPFPGMPLNYWVGLTDLLVERRNNTDGWRWTDGSIAEASDLLWFSATEPGDVSRRGWADCVHQAWGTGKLADIGCNNSLPYKIFPMCQPRSSLSTEWRVSSYNRSAIPVGLYAFEYAIAGGCSRLLTTVMSAIECARRCNSEPDDWCVAFYFNQARKECRLVLYTDANIPMGSAEGWVKFVKEQNR